LLRHAIALAHSLYIALIRAPRLWHVTTAQHGYHPIHETRSAWQPSSLQLLGHRNANAVFTLRCSIYFYFLNKLFWAQRIPNKRLLNTLGWPTAWSPVPANGFDHICSNTPTVLVAFSDIVQCFRESWGGNKLTPSLRFSFVSSNAIAKAVHVAQAALLP